MSDDLNFTVEGQLAHLSVIGPLEGWRAVWTDRGRRIVFVYGPDGRQVDRYMTITNHDPGDED